MGIKKLSVLTDFEDKWKWSLTADGEFSVQSLRAEIEKVELGIGPYKTRWNNLVPTKINIFSGEHIITDSRLRTNWRC